MGISITFFDSVEDLTKYIEGELKVASQLYSSYTNRIENTRTTYQNESKQQKKSSNPARGSTTQTEIAGFRILSNPAPEHELGVLDDALETLREKIDALTRTKNELIPKLENNGRIAAIFEDTIPSAFMYYTE